MNKNNFSASALIGASLSVILITALTVIADLYLTLKNDILKAWHGHHWVGKGIWAAILFVVVIAFVYALARNNDLQEKLAKLTQYLTILLVSGTVVITIFFIWEFIAKH